MHLLVFELAGRGCALPAERVREIVRAAQITPLPEAPARIEGVLNVRGEIVPVYDLRARLGLAPRTLHPDEFLIIALGAGGRGVALRVDAVLDLVTVDDLSVRPAPAADGRAAAPADPAEDAKPPLVAGVTVMPDGVLLVYDLDALFSARDERVLDEALVTAGRAA